MMTTQRVLLFFCAALLGGCECGAPEGSMDGGEDAGAGSDAADACASFTPDDDGAACAFELDCVRVADGPLRCGRETWACVDGAIEYTDATFACADAAVDGGGDPDGGPPPGCGTNAPLFDGTLCGGGDGAPCDLIDEAELDGYAYRNFAPSIAVDDEDVPAVVWSTAVGGFTGYFARRDGPAWMQETLPIDFARGALGYRGSDPIVLAYTGAVAIHVLGREGASFAGRDPLRGITGERWVDVDDAGCVHLARLDDVGGALVYSVLRDTVWEHTTLVGETNRVLPDGSLALSEDGTPHVIYWEELDSAWRLRWRRGDDPAEDVPDTSNPLGDTSVATPLAVEGDRAHILVKRGRELSYRSRDAIGWSAITIDDDSITGCDPSAQPTAPGMVCTYERTTLRPLEVLTSASGDVRFLYSAVVENGSLVSTCEPFPGGPPACDWSGLPTFSGELRLASIAGEVRRTVLLEGVVVWAGRAVVDRNGRIHAALYTNDATGMGFFVRYAVFGTLF